MKIPEDAVAQEGVLESITKEGVPSAESIATTKPQKRRKHSNKRRLSGKGLPTGERQHVDLPPLCLQSFNDTSMKAHEKENTQEDILESRTKPGVTPTESTTMTKRDKRRKKRSKKRHLSRQGSPGGEMSKAPASASSVRKISWQCDNLPSDPQEDEPAAASPPKFSSSKLKAWGTPLRTSFVEATPLISLADSPALGTPTSVSVASKLDVVQAVSSPAKSSNKFQSNGRDETGSVARVMVAVLIAASVAFVIFSMVFNGQRVPRLPRVANISPTDTTDQMGNTTKPVYTYRSSASEKLNHPAPPVLRHQQQKSTA